MKYVIFNADDFGIDKSINEAILETYLKGLCSSISIITNTEYFDHAIELSKNAKIKSLCIHLNLTTGKPLINVKNNPLCNKNGFFNYKAYQFFLPWIIKNKKQMRKLIYDEFDQQINKLLKSNIRISKIDSHEHIHQSNFIYDIIYDLSKKYKIKFIRTFDEKITFRNLIYRLIELNYIKFIVLKFNTLTRKKYDINNSISYYGVLDSGKIIKNNLLSYIDSLKSNYALEVNFHPKNYEINKNNLSKKECEDKKLLLSKNLKNSLLSRGIQIISFENVKL